MNQVNIYIAVSNKSPKSLNGKVGYVVEKEGMEPLSGIAPAQNLTCHQAEMTALYKALFSVKEPSHLVIYTESMYLPSSLRWLPTWKTNGWKNSKGKDLANREAWEALAQKLSGHETEFRVGEQHAFKKWLETEVNRKRGSTYV